VAELGIVEGKIWVRATISLPGLPLGRAVLVDPSDSYMADCLERGYLQPIQEVSEELPPEEAVAVEEISPEEAVTDA
jgi:hypothetical protein